jgi:hypothetical protein
MVAVAFDWCECWSISAAALHVPHPAGVCQISWVFGWAAVLGIAVASAVAVAVAAAAAVNFEVLLKAGCLQQRHGQHQQQN